MKMSKKRTPPHSGWNGRIRQWRCSRAAYLTFHTTYLLGGQDPALFRRVPLVQSPAVRRRPYSVTGVGANGLRSREICRQHVTVRGVAAGEKGNHRATWVPPALGPVSSGGVRKSAISPLLAGFAGLAPGVARRDARVAGVEEAFLPQRLYTIVLVRPRAPCKRYIGGVPLDQCPPG